MQPVYIMIERQSHTFFEMRHYKSKCLVLLYTYQQFFGSLHTVKTPAYGT